MYIHSNSSFQNHPEVMKLRLLISVGIEEGEADELVLTLGFWVLKLFELLGAFSLFELKLGFFGFWGVFFIFWLSLCG